MFLMTRAAALVLIETWRFNDLWRSDWLSLWIDVTLALSLSPLEEDHGPPSIFCPISSTMTLYRLVYSISSFSLLKHITSWVTCSTLAVTRFSCAHRKLPQLPRSRLPHTISHLTRRD